ncbi:DoxX family protein [Cellulomonas marina]|uniref:Uncharacterized membrane protein n=1 Tax=Cellulomonas marina TaxID=988821 RepID=A0A1I0XGL3_9CELL|nr:hypothetical protein [Cellulomonas marina]GIG29878.1 hypothetical protein Cma02nite_24780 [Cellulomonas marina]SFA99388.1 Uncharacterized membrane protein [Cellulomonas marina]
MTTGAAARRHLPALALAGLLGAAGVLHLRRPAVFEPLIPAALGPARPWVLGSGVAELACAALLVPPAARRLGGLASAALLVAVLPGNAKMALDADGSGPWTRDRRVTLLRLPLQAPLVAWALAVARHGAGTTPPSGALLPRPARRRGDVSDDRA